MLRWHARAAATGSFSYYSTAISPLWYPYRALRFVRRSHAPSSPRSPWQIRIRRLVRIIGGRLCPGHVLRSRGCVLTDAVSGLWLGCVARRRRLRFKGIVHNGPGRNGRYWRVGLWLAPSHQALPRGLPPAADSVDGDCHRLHRHAAIDLYELGDEIGRASCRERV